MRNLKILITAGPTREYLDPIRFISNPSSGKMGIAIAEEALALGADVTVVYGKGIVEPPKGARVINVETTEEMSDSVVNELKNRDYNIFIAVSASADYGPLKTEKRKIPSKQESLVIHLKPTPKIIEHARKVSQNIFLCAFKAEANIPPDELIEKAYKSLKEVEIDLIVANDIGKPDCGFEVDTNEVYIIDDKRDVTYIPLTSKREIAKKVLDIITERIGV